MPIATIEHFICVDFFSLDDLHCNPPVPSTRTHKLVSLITRLDHVDKNIIILRMVCWSDCILLFHIQIKSQHNYDVSHWYWHIHHVTNRAQLEYNMAAVLVNMLDAILWCFFYFTKKTICHCHLFTTNDGRVFLDPSVNKYILFCLYIFIHVSSITMTTWW